MAPDRPDRPRIAVLTFPGESSPPGIDMLADLAQVSIATNGSELEHVLPESDVLLVLDFRSNLLRKAWPSAKRLKWVHAASAGANNVLFPEIRDSDVVLTNAHGVFGQSVAEWVLATMLMFCKDLHTTRDLQRVRTWRHRETERLADKHALVVGAGGIGRATVLLARTAGMHAAVVARTARQDNELGVVHGFDDLDRVLPPADFVVLAAPLTAETHRIIDDGRLRLMRPSTRLINVSRGELVDQHALVEALSDGRLAGAALDVFDEEPLPRDHPFWSMPNVIVSPHMSGDFLGWRPALMQQFADNVRRWIAGKPLPSVVDKHAGYAPTADRRADHT